MSLESVQRFSSLSLRHNADESLPSSIELLRIKNRLLELYLKESWVESPKSMSLLDNHDDADKSFNTQIESRSKLRLKVSPRRTTSSKIGKMPLTISLRLSK